MIEIGKSLPNLTDPTETMGAALALAFNDIFLKGSRAPAIKPALRSRCYFTDENLVGTSNWLTMLLTIWPLSSVLARAAIHSGSLWNAAHFLSRSASDSQASR